MAMQAIKAAGTNPRRISRLRRGPALSALRPDPGTCHVQLPQLITQRLALGRIPGLVPGRGLVMASLIRRVELLSRTAAHLDEMPLLLPLSLRESGVVDIESAKRDCGRHRSANLRQPCRHRIVG